MLIDLADYKATLHREASEVFPTIIKDLADEGIYSLALYNSGDTWSYLFPTVSTRRGLQSVFEAYRAEGAMFGADMTDEQLIQSLKWSPCDSPHHDEDYGNTLVQTEALLEPISNAAYESLDDHEDNFFYHLHESLVAATLEVLQQLRKDGVFAGLDPDEFVLNLLNGDQGDDERLVRARVLNTAPAYQRYADELVSSVLDDIEAEMKKIGYWNENPPSVEVRSYLEAPSFELWLQCVFLPNARNAVATGKFPEGSQVGEMASREYNSHERVWKALKLVSLLRYFDKLVVSR